MKADKRYREQVARRAQPKRQYRVTMRTDDGQEQTVRVMAVDGWLARTSAIARSTLNLCGQHVDYTVEEV